MKISLNTDLKVQGEMLHIQTEDWGEAHQKLVTRIYKEGRMIKSFEVKYTQLKQPLTAQTMNVYAQKLHQQVIDWVQENGINGGSNGTKYN